ncbi:hypothetical protein N0A02_04120 [Paraburkholderia acidicola]|uniref:Uncharacterized protein n=1 Tax=Paraburkholderia acidicola TaxID=1912599 RepID=A0ABV1LH84_9BURK
MKTSTLMTMALLSASCFAAPTHTARDSTEATIADRAGSLSAVPASAAGPAVDATAPQQWETIALPKSRHLSHAFDTPDEHLQT